MLQVKTIKNKTVFQVDGKINSIHNTLQELYILLKVDINKSNKLIRIILLKNLENDCLINCRLNQIIQIWGNVSIKNNNLNLEATGFRIIGGKYD